jgi:hypothetical protein
MAIASDAGGPGENLFEGVYLLQSLIQVIIADPARSAKALSNVN